MIMREIEGIRFKLTIPKISDIHSLYINNYIWTADDSVQFGEGIVYCGLDERQSRAVWGSYDDVGWMPMIILDTSIKQLTSMNKVFRLGVLYIDDIPVNQTLNECKEYYYGEDIELGYRGEDARYKIEWTVTKDKNILIAQKILILGIPKNVLASQGLID